jgi:hypothetical protein
MDSRGKEDGLQNGDLQQLTQLARHPLNHIGKHAVSGPIQLDDVSVAIVSANEQGQGGASSNFFVKPYRPYHGNPLT